MTEEGGLTGNPHRDDILLLSLSDLIGQSRSKFSNIINLDSPVKPESDNKMFSVIPMRVRQEPEYEASKRLRHKSPLILKLSSNPRRGDGGEWIDRQSL